VATSVESKYNVGGVLLDRPFKVRRLGHFGFDSDHIDESARFYTELLGFRISDVVDLSGRLPPEQLAGMGSPRMYFTRYGTDHHAFALFNRPLRRALDHRPTKPEVTINQLTWQVGSLREVANACEWFRERGVEIQRSGRDRMGSNWHTYVYDPDDHVNEVFYGIEQVGWDGHSKPLDLKPQRVEAVPELPYKSEQEEVQAALARGIDLLSGSRYVDALPATYDVDGILLPRPFKIVRIGPVGLFVEDVATAEAFYRDMIGLVRTEEIVWQEHRCVFLRANTEHHALALYPRALREVLGLSPHTTCMAFGLQVATYQQLRDAVGFLRDRGARVVDLPPELHPGIDYAAHVVDPDGHALQLYYYMEQLGWDGRPRPRKERPRAGNGSWPETIEGRSDTYLGEPFMGPWG
jgi:catechol 2,3-dioxygenase-like lactoylglutathione lyase family enzyme